MSLRRWQKAALLKFEAGRRRNFLAVATPGAGKTTFALSACVRALRAGVAGRVLVVAPTSHLKLQWAEAAEQFGLALESGWASSDGQLPSDMHGVIVTYQQVAASANALRPMSKNAFAIIDEVHHAAESRAWGDGIRHALAEASRRLCLSGTPFRSDQNAIPFVRYDGDNAVPDYEYGYAEALSDRRVVRPVYFPRIGGRMEWSSSDGTSHQYGFKDEIGKRLAGERLRTALSLGSEWLPAILTQANTQLNHLRQSEPSAGGMVIAMDQDHARGIAQIFRQHLGVKPIIATSDDPEASQKISAFSNSESPWIVAVRMVSEGVDIPRLRVGVYATNTTTDLFFRQAVGRLVRFTGSNAGQRAYMYIPDDSRLRSFAMGIREQRRHSLYKEETPDEISEQEVRDPLDEQQDEQMTLFNVISATPLAINGENLDASQVFDDDAAEAADAPSPDDEVQGEEALEFPIVDTQFRTQPVGSGIDFELTAPVLEEQQDAAPTPLPRKQRKELRSLNAARAKSLARLARLTHAEVNAELNRRAGIRRVTEATTAQLDRRLQVADAWLQKLTRSVTP
jgi:superfamily II DNA or RNA helicase